MAARSQAGWRNRIICCPRGWHGERTECGPASSRGPPGTRVPLRGDKADDVHYPVRVGAQSQVRRAGAADRGGYRVTLGRRRLGVPEPKLRIGGLDLVQRTGFRVDELYDAGVRQLDLARIEYLDREKVVTDAESAQRLLPG